MNTRKTITVILALLTTVALSGCGSAPPELSEPTPGLSVPGVSEPAASEQSSSAPEKQLLKLEDLSKVDHGFDSAENIVITRRAVNIPAGDLAQSETELPLSSAKLPDGLLSEISKDFPDEVFTSDKWTYFVNMIAEDGSFGQLRLLYNIGDIGTNKAVTCVIENGAITGISYTNMSFSLTAEQEKELISRAERFLETHIQEKRQFADGERFLNEQTKFTYYYNLDTLRYSYALFFEYGQPARINNDFGTECNVV